MNVLNDKYAHDVERLHRPGNRRYHKLTTLLATYLEHPRGNPGTGHDTYK